MLTAHPQCTGYQRYVHRRDFLRQAGGGLGLVALSSLLSDDRMLHAAPQADGKVPHHRPGARRVLLLFMSAGVSHIDTFDYKPALAKYHGQPLTARGNITDVFFRQPGNLMQSPFKFQQYGQTGKWVSEIFPHVAAQVDDLTFIHSMVAEQNSHGPAMYHMSTGFARNGYPSLGSWALYGLGSETQNLPAFITLADRGTPPSGAANWGNAFLPARYQGTPFRSEGNPILDLTPPGDYSSEKQRASFDLLARLNARHLEAHPGDSELAARIEAYELAARMQLSAPDVADLSGETEETLSLYGVDRPDRQQATFSRICLLGRRLLERGVRFVSIYCGGSNNVPDFNWDAHANLEKNHRLNAAISDQPVAALLTDLRRRGLLEDTLVIWTGEFGRTPTSEGANGRDHNIGGFTLWMAGGGVRPGTACGTTDEIGFRAEERPVPICDYHATVLHLLGIDHERLTFYHNGLQQRLTGVKGQVVSEILKG